MGGGWAKAELVELEPRITLTRVVTPFALVPKATVPWGRKSAAECGFLGRYGVFGSDTGSPLPSAQRDTVGSLSPRHCILIGKVSMRKIALASLRLLVRLELVRRPREE